jgi:hypothetical protein
MLAWGGYSYNRIGWRNDLWGTRDGETFRVLADSIPYWNRPIEIPRNREFASSVVFRDSLWLIAGDPLQAKVWVSADGVNWIRAAQGTTFPPRAETNSLVFKNRIWIFGGRTVGGNPSSFHDVWSSADGRDWRMEGEGYEGAGTLTVHRDTLWRAFASKIAFSVDGLNWIELADLSGRFPSGIGLTAILLDGQVVFFSNRSIAWYFDADQGRLREVPFPSPPILGTTLMYRGRLFVLGSSGMMVL